MLQMRKLRSSLNSDFSSPILLFTLHNFASHWLRGAAIDLCLSYSASRVFPTYLFYTSKRNPIFSHVHSSKVLRIAMGYTPIEFAC